MPRVPAIAALSALLLAAACTSGEGGEGVGSTSSLAGAVPVATTTTVPAAYAEFCDEMLALDERTDDADAEGADAVDDVIETYTELLPIAPLEIGEELEAVLERVELARAGRALDDEEVAVAEDAATRVSGWVDLNCRGIANNPGPPATPPT
jgi:hypothetical protein